MVSNRFAALTLTHDVGLRAYETAPGASTDAGELFLTDVMINPRCTVAAAAVSLVSCRGAVDPETRLGTGQTYVDIGVYYQPPDGAAPSDFTVDGYRAEVQTSGRTDAVCVPKAPGGGIEVDLSPIAAHVQPSSIVLDACFGGRSTTAREAFMAMVRSATIHARADESVAVPRTEPCTTHHLSVREQRPVGVNSAESELVFQLTNTGAATCHLRGYPRVQVYGDGTLLPFRLTPIPPGGHSAPETLYLHHGQHATLQLDVRTCDIAGGPDRFLAATRLNIKLEPADTPVVVMLGLHQLDFCSEPLRIWALTGS